MAKSKKEKVVDQDPREICETCAGSGMATEDKSCPDCKGSGRQGELAKEEPKEE